MLQDQKVFLVTQKDPDMDNPGLIDVYKIGTIAPIKQVVKLPKGITRVLVEGIERAEVTALRQKDCFFGGRGGCELDNHELEPLSANAKEAMLRGMKDIFSTYAKDNQRVSKDLVRQILERRWRSFADQICINISLPYEKKQRFPWKPWMSRSVMSFGNHPEQ